MLTAVLFLSFACRQKKIDEIYLIPRGFTGNIAVVFDVKQGEKEVLENGWRVYRIPEDGILITQASYNSTFHNEKYFFVDGDERVPITGVIYGDAQELQWFGLSDNDVFVRINGAVGGANRPNYSLHYVGNRKGMDANTNDFDFSQSVGLDVKVESKLGKLPGEKIFK